MLEDLLRDKLLLITVLSVMIMGILLGVGFFNSVLFVINFFIIVISVVANEDNIRNYVNKIKEKINAL